MAAISPLPMIDTLFPALCDNGHNKTVSFNNCMLRIPGSFNSKNNVQVKVIQKWSGTEKVPVNLLYNKFLAYTVDKGRQNLTKNRPKPFSSKNGSLASINVLQRFYQRGIRARKRSLYLGLKNSCKLHCPGLESIVSGGRQSIERT